MRFKSRFVADQHKYLSIQFRIRYKLLCSIIDYNIIIDHYDTNHDQLLLYYLVRYISKLKAKNTYT